jgi:hypothetical protein
MMRLTLIPCVCVLTALLTVPAAAQRALPARGFEPSLPSLAAVSSPPTMEWWRSGGPRIRHTDERTAAALRSGQERSPLVRQLVSRIEASNVFLYVGIDPRMSSGLAGRLTFVGGANSYRYMRALLNPELGGERLIAAIAHELQHVVEVIDHPEVTSERGLAELYARIGQPNRAGGVLGWETTAAIDMGYDVRRELTTGALPALARRDTGTRDPAKRQDEF